MRLAPKTAAVPALHRLRASAIALIDQPRAVAGDPAFDRRVRGLAGAGLLTVASALCLLIVVEGWHGDASPAPAVAAMIAALTAAAWIGVRQPQVGAHVAAAAAIAVVAAAVASAGERAGISAIGFVPIAMYGAYFLAARPAAAHAAAIAAASGIAILTASPADALSTWLLVAGTTLLIAVVLRWVRERVRWLLQELDEASRRDALTGLLNRRGIEERLAHELARSARSHRPVSVLVGDLDSFKALNDSLGHRAGDEALRLVASLLLAQTRVTDAVGRLGGDEFVVVLPDVPVESAQHQAQRLAQLALMTFQGRQPPLSITFGAAAFPESASSADALVDAADRDLYAAKALLGRAR